MRLYLFILSLIMAVTLTAQPSVLTEQEFVSIILKFHPVAKQADIDVKMAKADILSGKSGFDPLLTRETARKDFSAITYYDRESSEIRIPTWYGIDLFAGTETITGSRVNVEETSGSITYLGFSVQPLQNLVMDKRRAVLLQAKNFHLLSKVQMRIALNDLVKEALYAYWDWWEKHHVHEIIKAALLNSEKRFGLVKSAYRLGDRPAIDTLEAFTQVQSLQIRLSEAYQSLIKASLELSTFLWLENGDQAELPADVRPQEYKQANTMSLADLLNLVHSHPELLQYDFKLKGLSIDKKLAFQSLLPDIKVKYNQTGYDLSKTVNARWFNNNYRYGVNLSIPLRLSEGRGVYQKAKLKIQRTQLDQANKQVILQTKVRQYFTEWQQTERQLSLQNGVLVNTIALQRGEEVRFANGESSLFLLNTRELKTIEAEQKLVELKSKMQKTAIGVRWSAGVLAS